MNTQRQIIIQLLKNALVEFYHKEQRNLELDVHEICHSHRLATYLEQQIRQFDSKQKRKRFKNYFVDIEFNRTEDGDSKRVFYNEEFHKTRCDILVHSKGLNDERENLLIIELKKNNKTERKELDIQEIKRMVSPAESGAQDKNICNTLLGVYLNINRLSYNGIKYWFENNQIVEEEFLENLS